MTGLSLVCEERANPTIGLMKGVGFFVFEHCLTENRSTRKKVLRWCAMYDIYRCIDGPEMHVGRQRLLRVLVSATVGAESAGCSTLVNAHRMRINHSVNLILAKISGATFCIVNCGSVYELEAVCRQLLIGAKICSFS